MKNTIKLALVAAMAMGATSAFATNGDNLIGLGAKSRAMGGTGIAHFNGSESATSNPALITKAKGTNFSFGGTYFRPDVKVETTNGAADGNPLSTDNPQSAESDAKHNIIPYVALTENLGNGWAVGASMFGSAGMGTDWRNEGPNGAAVGPGNTIIDPAGATGLPGLYAMRSNLLLLKFSVPVAYGQDNWSVGIAPVLMYGSLDISFDGPTGLASGSGTPLYSDVGNGSSASFGLGVELGAAYTLPDMGLTLGATYHSSIEMEYKDQISSAGAAFGFGRGAVAGFSDNLEQPAEYGLGIDWTEGDISVTADWKNVRWSNARGYQDFGWENQNVYALGAEYRMDDLSLRIGYNYAKNPIQNSTDGRGVISGTSPADPTDPSIGSSVGDNINTFNAVMFPAVTERHYTVGAGYQFTKNVGADFAVTYATSPDAIYYANTTGLGTVTVSNDQIAVSANLNYSY